MSTRIFAGTGPPKTCVILRTCEVITDQLPVTHGLVVNSILYRDILREIRSVQTKAVRLRRFCSQQVPKKSLPLVLDAFLSPSVFPPSPGLETSIVCSCYILP